MSIRKVGAMTRAEAAAIARAARAEKAPSLQDRFWSKVQIKNGDECWPWIAAFRKKGKELYGAFWLNGRHQPSNRVALVMSGIQVPDGMVVCHKCDSPSCCNPSHLFVGTQKENNDDKINKNRDCKGSNSPKAKLTEAEVAFIRSHRSIGSKRLPNGLPKKLAEQFNVTRPYISEILSRGWRHV